MRVHLRLIPIHEYNSTGLIRKVGQIPPLANNYHTSFNENYEK